MTTKSQFWTGLLMTLSALNLVAVWFAAGPVDPWHPTLHAILALTFGLWADRRMRPGDRGSTANALGSGTETAAHRDDLGDAQHQPGEPRDRHDVAEREHSQAREEERHRGRRDP
ncbi:MAG: hypothetical protein ACHQXA_11315 [Gemmatimonadales bacterium]